MTLPHSAPSSIGFQEDVTDLRFASANIIAYLYEYAAYDSLTRRSWYALGNNPDILHGHRGR